jgi:hypothetical protein
MLEIVLIVNEINFTKGKATKIAYPKVIRMRKRKRLRNRMNGLYGN